RSLKSYKYASNSTFSGTAGSNGGLPTNPSPLYSRINLRVYRFHSTSSFNFRKKMIGWHDLVVEIIPEK
ncbi:MAG: hypothetical protein WHV66_02235, partial [Anaerolineales bacterium]